MATPTEDDIRELQEQINELNKKLDQMSENMDKINESSGSVSKNIGDSNNLLKDAVSSITSISKQFREFATDSKAQYEWAEKLAESSKSTAINIGISVGRSQEFTKSFNVLIIGKPAPTLVSKRNFTPFCLAIFFISE